MNICVKLCNNLQSIGAIQVMFINDFSVKFKNKFNFF